MLVPVSASCLLETTYPVRIMVSQRTHILRRLCKSSGIEDATEGERKKECKRTIDQRELKCQIRVLQNNVRIFIVLLDQGFMSKLLGVAEQDGNPKEKDLQRNLEIYSPRVISLHYK